MWRRPAGKGPSCARPRAPGLCLYGVVAQIRHFHTYHNESSWATIAGRLAVSVGIWFGLQALFSALVEVHILVRLFALSATLAGDEGYVLGTLVFLIGGLVLWIAGSRLGLKRPSLPSKAAFVVSTAAFLGLAVPGLIVGKIAWLGNPRLVGVVFPRRHVFPELRQHALAGKRGFSNNISLLLSVPSLTLLCPSSLIRQHLPHADPRRIPRRQKTGQRR
jgi:hypothetical protein